MKSTVWALYALPETMSFPMFFYRKDIFTEFDLKVPETWDDVYDLIKVLSAENMEMGLSQALTQIRMYQQGEPWYKGNNIVSEGMATNLDSDVALEAFKNMTDIFTQYRQPLPSTSQTVSERVRCPAVLRITSSTTSSRYSLPKLTVFGNSFSSPAHPELPTTERNM